MTEKAKTAIETVEEFLAAMEAMDTERVRALSHPDISYQNVPFPPARGLAAFERQLAQFERLMTGFEVIMHNIAAAGDVVLTERTDILKRDGFEWSLWVCGTFEVRDGKVIVWRDRFDFADATVGAVRGAGRALLAAARGRLG